MEGGRKSVDFWDRPRMKRKRVESVVDRRFDLVQYFEADELSPCMKSNGAHGSLQ